MPTLRITSTNIPPTEEGGYQAPASGGDLSDKADINLLITQINATPDANKINATRLDAALNLLSGSAGYYYAGDHTWVELAKENIPGLTAADTPEFTGAFLYGDVSITGNLEWAGSSACIGNINFDGDVRIGGWANSVGLSLTEGVAELYSPDILSLNAPYVQVYNTGYTMYIAGYLGIGVADTGGYAFKVYGDDAGIWLQRTGGADPFIFVYNGTYGGQMRGISDRHGFKLTDAAGSTTYAWVISGGITIGNSNDTGTGNILVGNVYIGSTQIINSSRVMTNIAGMTLTGALIGAATQSVFNTVSTTINAFGAAAAVNIGSSSVSTVVQINSNSATPLIVYRAVSSVGATSAQVVLYAQDAASSVIQYIGVAGYIEANTAGAASASFKIAVRSAGTMTDRFFINNDGTVRLSNTYNGAGAYNIYLNGIYVGSTQLVDSSRNLLNIGTIGCGAITTTAALAVNNASGITSTQTTFNLLNATVTTLNIGGAATTINIGSSSGVVNFGGQYASAKHTTTTTVNWNNSNVQYIVLANGAQTFTFSNPVDGGRYILIIKQPASGAAGTVTFPASVLWVDGYTPILSLTNGKVDVFSFIYDGTNSKYYGTYASNF